MNEITVQEAYEDGCWGYPLLPLYLPDDEIEYLEIEAIGLMSNGYYRLHLHNHDVFIRASSCQIVYDGGRSVVTRAVG